MKTVDQNISSTQKCRKYISFAVDDVEMSAGKSLKRKEESLRSSLENRFYKERMNQFSLKEDKNDNDKFILVGVTKDDNVLTASYTNFLLGAVDLAFTEHYPLTLTPDAIWLAIVQGVAIHINKYQEEYRKFLVDHKGILELRVDRPDLTGFNDIFKNISNITESFLELLQKNTSKIHFDLFQGGFSTSTNIEKTCYGIACMDAFSPYFKYVLTYGCGFPEIRIAGELEDWLKIRSKINDIEELFYINENINLTWWTEKLKKVADEFILAAKGTPNIDWWKLMYKDLKVYMSSLFNGWIGWLFPYTKNEGQLIRNPMLDDIGNTLKNKTFRYGVDENNYVLDHEKDLNYSDIVRSNVDWSIFSKTEYIGPKFKSIESFPSGMSKVNLVLENLATGERTDSLLVGGFLGIKQDDDGNINPLISYAMFT